MSLKIKVHEPSERQESPIKECKELLILNRKKEGEKYQTMMADLENRIKEQVENLTTQYQRIE